MYGITPEIENKDEALVRQSGWAFFSTSGERRLRVACQLGQWLLIDDASGRPVWSGVAWNPTSQQTAYVAAVAGHLTEPGGSAVWQDGADPIVRFTVRKHADAQDPSTAEVRGLDLLLAAARGEEKIDVMVG